jgi:spermidine/putrescine-binding protein
VKKALPKVAAVMAPAALPGLFQQGQIDICYTNTNNVASLKTRGADIAFAFPEKSAITFITTLHIAKGAENVENAYAYIDTALSATAHETSVQHDPYQHGRRPCRSADQEPGRARQDEDPRLEQDQSAPRRLDRALRQGGLQVSREKPGVRIEPREARS